MPFFFFFFFFFNKKKTYKAELKFVLITIYVRTCLG